MDHRPELRRLAALIKRLDDEFLAGVHNDDEDFFRERIEGYQERRRKLILEQKSQGNGYRVISMGQTVGEYWQACDVRQQNAFLCELGIRIIYDKREGPPRFQIDFGEVEALVGVAQHARNSERLTSEIGGT
ncbi:hypothetical protein ACIBH1_32480 [Nonomuraea sp. NPDC050663]|uniref:hypothetical protein n=1 Tax=Nonomuraea sp. NPDC050663 TaxID=3364370 RepID=UPI003793C366